MELREISAGDTEAVAAAVGIREASRAATPWEHPRTVFRYGMTIEHGWDLEPGRYFLALVEDSAMDRPVGYLEVHASDYDNPELAWVILEIDPAVRRRGHGTALMDAAYDICRAMGRTSLVTFAWESEEAAAFAAATGWERKSQVILRRLHLAEVGTEVFEEAYAESLPHAGDYELLRFAGETPASMHAALGEVSESINDAPLDDLEMEDEVYPVERVRDYETAMRLTGHRLYRTVARHRVSGELAGHSALVVDSEQPSIAHQHDTTVARAHRGHRLGLLLKADVLRWLAEVEPQLETIDTWNAESNDHMIAVNERLGFRSMGREWHLQKRI